MRFPLTGDRLDRGRPANLTGICRLAPIFVVLVLLCAASGGYAQEPQGRVVLQTKAGLYDIRATLTPNPPQVGPIKVIIEIGRDGKPLVIPPDADLSMGTMGLILDMPSMPGMKATRCKTRFLAPGRYEADGEFSMEGDWRLHFLTWTPQGSFQVVAPLLRVGDEATTVSSPIINPSNVSSPSSAPSSATTAGPNSPAASPSPSAAGSLQPSPSVTSPSVTGSPQPSPSAAGSPPSSLPAGAATPPPAEPEASPRTPLAIAVSPDPPQVGTNVFNFRLPDSVDATARVIVGVDMPGMAMNVPPVTATRRPDGVWTAALPLSMYGLWHLNVDADAVNGQPLVRGTASLKLGPPRTLSSPQRIAVVALFILIPIGIAWGMRRQPVGSLVACASLIIATFGAGYFIERYWPPDTSMGMVMDMNAPDMGMGDMTAPAPVLVAVAQRIPFTVRNQYPARVEPASESVVLASLGGPLTELAEVGRVVKPGDLLGRIGTTAVTAPRGGVVVRRFAEPGSVVAAQAPLLAVADVRVVRVVARVPVADHDRIVPGLQVDAVSGEIVVDGTLSAVSAVTEGNALRVEARVVNEKVGGVASMDGEAVSTPTAPLRPGLLAVGENVVLRCIVDRRDSALCVPRDAVHESGGKAVVFVVADVVGQKVARRRLVTTGLSNETHTEITSGLREGEPVVAQAEQGLQDGAVVTLATYGTGQYRALLIPRGEDAGH